MADIDSVVQSLVDNQISGRSPVCKEFEEAFSSKFGVQNSIAVNSGTSALFLALKALGIGEGDEVIVPAFGFIAIANAVKHTGATPVFVDVEYDTFNIDPLLIIPTPKTKAIIAVHTYGLPCDMDKLMAFGIPVIEDAAEAHGAIYKGKMVGSIGDIGCFSFFANKTITTGEGGMVMTNNPVYAKEIRLLKDQYNGNIKFKHDGIGYGMSLGALQCALGKSQLSRLDNLVKRKRTLAKKYTSSLLEYVDVPLEKNGFHSFWMYAIKTKKGLAEFLEAHGIETRRGFFPLNFQPSYSDGSRFPVAEELYEKITCLPMSLGMSEEEQNYVIELVKNFCA